MTTTAAEPTCPTCPKCQGPCWDNRLTKRNPKQPDFKCKDRGCDGVIWPPKNGAKPAAPVKQPFTAGPPLPYEEAALRERGGLTDDALPHEKLDHLFLVYSLVEAHVLATSVPMWTKADVGTTPESVAAQIATIFIQATKAGV